MPLRYNAYLPNNPETLYAELDKSDCSRIAKCLKIILNDTDFNLVYPDELEVDVETFEEAAGNIVHEDCGDIWAIISLLQEYANKRRFNSMTKENQNLFCYGENALLDVSAQVEILESNNE